MKLLIRQCLVAAVALAACSALAEEPSKASPGQSIADILCSATSAPVAFVPDGVLNPTGKNNDLSSWLQFPAGTVSVVKLTGKKFRAAIERSVSLYPSPNPSFLQLSGVDVTFDKDQPADHRVTSITVLGAPLEDAKTYEVAMPTSLAQGGAGYFLIWEKSDVVRTLKTTLGSLCKGKAVLESDSRYKTKG
ncbi:MAG: 5'-nucleotidase C-terminal domain-containing protein [Fimbriimonadaceae bacterium]|nr:5'-nucleotidase C-terminal domain-containing protein [Fimbriimonadaceae bacterium]